MAGDKIREEAKQAILGLGGCRGSLDFILRRRTHNQICALERLLWLPLLRKKTLGNLRRGHVGHRRGLVREMLACISVVAMGTERTDGCSLEAVSARLADECGWIERERGGVQGGSLVFALSNRVHGGKYILRWGRTVVQKQREFCFGQVKFEMSFKHLSGDVKYLV